MSENLLVPVVRYLAEDLSETEWSAACKDGHVAFLAKAFDLEYKQLFDAVENVRGEQASERATRAIEGGIKEGWRTGGIFGAGKGRKL